MAIIAKIGDVESAPIKPSRPKWVDVYNGYPQRNNDDIPAIEVFSQYFGNDYATKWPQLTDACATRISIALIKSGIRVRADFMIQKGDYQGKGIITSSLEMIKWLKQKFGEPDISLEAPQTVDNVRKELKNKKGVYAMQPLPNVFTRAVGHITLWTGTNVIGGHHYIEGAQVIYFWELK